MPMKVIIRKPTGKLLPQHSGDILINIARFQMAAFQQCECRKEAFKTVSERKQSIFL